MTFAYGVADTGHDAQPPDHPTGAVTPVAVTGLISLNALTSLEGRYCAPDPPCTIFSFSFRSTVSTVRSISGLGVPS